MRVGQKAKEKMRYAPRYASDSANRREDGVYYNDWCCSGCYWDWGRSWSGQNLHNHGSAYSNYQGILKKYWTLDRDPDEWTNFDDQ